MEADGDGEAVEPQLGERLKIGREGSRAAAPWIVSHTGPSQARQALPSRPSLASGLCIMAGLCVGRAGRHGGKSREHF